MDPETAIQRYREIAPSSAEVLRACLLQPLTGLAWHHVEGDDLYGRLLESLELRFRETSVFLRKPHDECGGYRISDCEVASGQPAEELAVHGHAIITHLDNPNWLQLVGCILEGVDLLLDLKDPRFARYHGIRCRFSGGHTLGYHYQWGDRIGDPIPRHVALIVDGSDPPSRVGWSFVPWLSPNG